MSDREIASKIVRNFFYSQHSFYSKEERTVKTLLSISLGEAFSWYDTGEGNLWAELAFTRLETSSELREFLIENYFKRDDNNFIELELFI